MWESIKRFLGITTPPPPPTVIPPDASIPCPDEIKKQINKELEQVDQSLRSHDWEWQRLKARIRYLTATGEK